MSSIFTIIFVFLGLSIMILLHELGHFLAARFFGLRVEEFGFGLPPRLWGKKIGETIYSVNWLPFGGFVKIYGEDGAEALFVKSPLRKSVEESLGSEKNFRTELPYKKAIIILAGVVTNFILGWILLSLVFVSGTDQQIIIGSVLKNSPAEEVGIKPNDIILNVSNLESGGSVSELIDFINKNKGKEIILKVKRVNEVLEFGVVPRVDPPRGEGALGVSLVQLGSEPQGVFRALYGSFRESLVIASAVALSLVNLLVGIITGLGVSGVVGPVGIFEVAIQSGQLGFVYLLQLLALISLNLAVLNIIPFPALDGGRLFFVLIEKIKGSPLSLKTETIINSIGFFLLLFLMVLITIKDVGRIF